MTAKGDRSFIADLAGLGGLTGDVDGVDGVEAGDSRGTTEMTGPDQVGLLKVAHLTGRDIGIGRSVGGTFGLGLFRSSGLGQDLLGRDAGKPADAPSLKLEMDRFGTDSDKSRTTDLVGRQFVAQDQDFPEQGLLRLMRDMSRYPTLITKPIKPEFSIVSEPFVEPPASIDTLHGVAEPAGLFIDSKGFEPDLICGSLSHDRLLLPIGFGRSVDDPSKCSRCLYVNSLGSSNTFPINLSILLYHVFFTEKFCALQGIT